MTKTAMTLAAYVSYIALCNEYDTNHVEFENRVLSSVDPSLFNDETLLNNILSVRDGEDPNNGPQYYAFLCAQLINSD